MDLPDSAVAWLAANAKSNQELAKLSNVSSQWRRIVAETILTQAEASLQTKTSENGDDRELLLLPSMVRHLLLKERTTNNFEKETYCLAWFHPSGIQFIKLPVDAMDDSDFEDNVASAGDHRSVSPAPFAPSGEQSYAGSEEERKTSRRHHHHRSASSSLVSLTRKLGRLEDSERFVNCLHQWDGFSEAYQILQPFGFAQDFVKDVLDQTKSLIKAKYDDQMAISTSPNYRTFAVRGATIARPEGYCLCWDNEVIFKDSASRNQNDSKLELRRQESDQLTRQKQRRRRELQREVLPKVVNSALTNSIDDMTGDGETKIRLPCVQFLNVDSSHAVRLFTPRFQRPVSTPITVFCVGIATEDGCFFSGLKRRFEMGHLYPETPQDDLIEQSPVCLCTSTSAPDWMEEDTNDDEQAEDGDESFNSDDSSSDARMRGRGGDPGFKCSCPFSGLGDNADETDDEDDMEEQVCRGGTGPGAWHCYVAVFDGVTSTIRVDGVQEPVRCTMPVSGEDISFLDGLTIGADHTFDMSLCFGEGSDGEGEGAIAELAVFKGRLNDDDIITLESRLMESYGIVPPDLSDGDLTETNQMSRLAHAMLSHPPRHKLFSSESQRIPLRIMTKHRIVAWRQTNPVTGERILVQRIGTKFAGSSSDW